MERRRALLADVFPTAPLTGIRVGVVPDANGLSETQRSAIAAELAGEETAFVSTNDAEDRWIDVLGGTELGDYPGVATIASAATLSKHGMIPQGTHEFRSDEGICTLEIQESDITWLSLGNPTVRSVPAAEETLADALGIEQASIVTEELPVGVGAVNRQYLIVPVDYLSTVGSVTPDADALAALLSTHEAEAAFTFTFDTLDRQSTLHGRLFRPELPDVEAPVPADASGAVGAYLRHVDAFDSMPDELIVEQGYYLDRPGRARVKLAADVRVGGRVLTTFEGELLIPEANDDDEIIEV